MSRSDRKPRKTIWTPANIVTTIRMVFIPIWIWVAEVGAPQKIGEGFSWPALGIALFYGVLALTDKLDGYLARSRNEVTTFGKFLDPIADKLVVTTALLYLLEYGLVPMWMVVVIIAREFIVSGLRMVVASAGVVIAASNLGKYKTAVTMGAIVALLVYMALPAGGFATFVKVGSDIAMIVAVILTAWSGIDYLWKCKDYLLEAE